MSLSPTDQPYGATLASSGAQFSQALPPATKPVINWVAILLVLLAVLLLIYIVIVSIVKRATISTTAYKYFVASVILTVIGLLVAAVITYKLYRIEKYPYLKYIYIFLYVMILLAVFLWYTGLIILRSQALGRFGAITLLILTTGLFLYSLKLSIGWFAISSLMVGMSVLLSLVTFNWS